MEPMPERWSEVREHLLPVVRGICRPPGSLTRMNTDPSRAPIRRPLAPFLSELVVVDGEMTRQYVTPRQLEQWGVDAHRVFHAARGNLAPTEGLGRVGDFFVLAAGDGYDSSRLVLPGWLEAFSELVQGVPVVAALAAVGWGAGISKRADARECASWRRTCWPIPPDWHRLWGIRLPCAGKIYRRH